MKLSMLSAYLFILILSESALAATYEQGRNLYQGKQFGEARKVFLEVARDCQATTLTAAAKVYAALCLYDQRDYENFKKEGTVLITEYEGQHINRITLTKYRLANLALIQGKWPEAVEALGRFAAEHPQCEYTFAALCNQAKALSKMGRHREARQIYLDFIGRFPKSTFIQNAKLKAALSLYAVGDYGAFEREGKMVLAQYPASPRVDAEWLRLHLAQMPG